MHINRESYPNNYPRLEANPILYHGRAYRVALHFDQVRERVTQAVRDGSLLDDDVFHGAMTTIDTAETTVRMEHARGQRILGCSVLNSPKGRNAEAEGVRTALDSGEAVYVRSELDPRRRFIRLTDSPTELIMQDGYIRHTLPDGTPDVYDGMIIARLVGDGGYEGTPNLLIPPDRLLPEEEA
jgi:hypothetical protein